MSVRLWIDYGREDHGPENHGLGNHNLEDHCLDDIPISILGDHSDDQLCSHIRTFLAELANILDFIITLFLLASVAPVGSVGPHCPSQDQSFCITTTSFDNSCSAPCFYLAREVSVSFRCT